MSCCNSNVTATSLDPVFPAMEEEEWFCTDQNVVCCVSSLLYIADVRFVRFITGIKEEERECFEIRKS